MDDKTYVVNLEEDDEGNLVLPFPQSLLEEMGWEEGTVLYWHDNKDGTYSISDKENQDDQ